MKRDIIIVAMLNSCETARAKDAYYYYHGITLISHDGPSLPYHNSCILDECTYCD